VRLASSLADTAIKVKIELNNAVINGNYSTTNTVGNPSIIDLDVPDTGQHQLTLTFLNDAGSEGEDLNLIIGRCQLSNTDGQFVLGSYLVNDPSYNLSGGWMEALYFSNESFTLNVDCDSPINWFDWNSGGNETMIETQALSISDHTLSFSTGDEIHHRISYNAVNTPITISINPNLAAWINYNDLEFNGIIPEGTDETYVVTIADSTGATASANLTFKQE
jgi:hypothetical protein